MLRSLRVVSLLAGVTLGAGFAAAHHSQAGIFDSAKNIEVTGVIKTISWRNPHGQILLTAKNADGTETEWDAETASIAVLRNRGAEPSAVVVGDRVTIAGAPSVRGRNEILARSMLLSSGYEFTFGGAQAYFPEGKCGPHRRPRDDRSRRRGGDGQGRRHLPRLVDDHERPGRVPDVQRRLSADGRGPRRARAVESARQLAAAAAARKARR